MPDTLTSRSAPADTPQPDSTRLARLVRRGKWLILAVWIALAVVATGFAANLGDVQRDDPAAYLPSGYESSQVAELVEPDPEHPDSETALVLYTREDGGALTDADLAAVADAGAAVAAGDVVGVDGPGDVTVSEDGAGALFPVDIQPEHADDETVDIAVEELREVVHPAPDGLSAQVTGEAALGVDNSGGDVDAALMLTSMVIVAALLLLTYRSPILWLVPLLGALVAVLVARGAAYGLAEAGLAVSDLSSAILIVLVFGAATDYALLFLSRYREELTRHEDRHEAIAEALRRTTPAIVASAGTVTAGLLCLLVADLAGLRGLGPVAAAGIVVSVLVMLTLLPALLACAGRWLLWPRVPWPDRPRGATEHRFWGGIADRVVRRPRLALVLVTVPLCLATLGLTELRTSADPVDKVPPDAESVVGREALAEHFPEGLSAPLTVVLPPGSGAAELAAAETAVSGVPEIAATLPGEPIDERPSLRVEMDVPPYGDEAQDTIREVRAALAEVVDGTLVGGTPAVQLDYHEAALGDTKRIVPLVLVAIAVILALLLRSLVAPVLLIVATVLSFAASLGLSTLVFTEGMGFGGVAADLFVYIFVFLVALGVDYTIFLMERVREERRHRSTREAVRHGVAATGGVITAAGLVLAGTFAALGQIPDVTVAEVGIGVAIGVLIETLLVRSVQVPALVTLLGDRVWWPRHRGSAKENHHHS
ncbi:MMPL family transporter [Streptomyces radicis]|nr:MMPL family transporter [Streptomyces radicis]